jgi:hypothetical protein
VQVDSSLGVDMEPRELVGTWGFNHGYSVGDKEARIQFNCDGSGSVNPHADAIPFRWELRNSTELYLSFHKDRWAGPHHIQISQKELPLGTFTSLQSDHALLPFGLKQFQLIESTIA